jgi:(E)-4-hydroxy-3-methylbut-2-enyl-diphosphate synthase
VRVSLTEDPEREAPVAKALIDRYTNRTTESTPIPVVTTYPLDPFSYKRRETREVFNFGGSNVPRVIADFSQTPITDMRQLKAIGHFYLPEPDKWAMNDLGADFVYTGSTPAAFMLPNGLKEILDFDVWLAKGDTVNTFPLYTAEQYLNTQIGQLSKRMNLVRVSLSELSVMLTECIKDDRTAVFLIETDNAHAMPELRRLFVELMNRGVTAPVVVQRSYPTVSPEDLPLYAATDVGGLLVDGLGDGVMLSGAATSGDASPDAQKRHNELAFGILQAARTRITKTEYISCPSCGRTLFDLQETTAMIRQRTEHLKGIKIGIMGCIVNGPGEMADADYGYVGIGRDKIALYRGQQVIKKSVPAAKAVDELIELIREDGRWLETENSGIVN